MRSRKHRGLPRYWRVRRLADGTETYWHEPAARDRHVFPAVKLPPDRAQALLECERRNAELDRWKAGLAPAPSAGPATGTFAALVAAFKESRAWAGIKARTRADYARHLDALVAVFGPVPVAGITRPVVMRYREKVPATRQGNYRLQVLRRVMGFAADRGDVPSNPAARPGTVKLAPRDDYWTAEDAAAFKAAAPAPLRLALDLALWTGQRPADVLAMRWTDIEGGWLTIRQRKTGKMVSIPVSDALRATLAAAPRRGILILVGERGAPYNVDSFGQRVRKVEAAAGRPFPTFAATRRTAVVNLAEAGCTVPQIAAITGHGIDDCQRILDTYWVATRTQARAAITKLERHAARKSPSGTFLESARATKDRAK